MTAPLAPPPPDQAAPPDATNMAQLDAAPIPEGPMPVVDGPILPVVPQTMTTPAGPEVTQTTSQVFAGPYAAQATGAGARGTALHPLTARRHRRPLMLTRFVRTQLIIFTIASISAWPSWSSATCSSPPCWGSARST